MTAVPNVHALVPVASPDDDSSLRPATLAQLREFAETFAVSQLLPAHLRGSPANVAITVLYGRELGLTPMQAIQGIYVVEGKPSLAAQMAVALVKRSPLCEYFRLVESTDKKATYETKRKGNPEPTRMSFTIEQAARAGLAGKKVWAQYPEAMLRNRASMALAREEYSDVVSNIHDPEELDEVRPLSGVVAPPTPPPPPARGWGDDAIDVESTPVAPAGLPTLIERLKAATTMAELDVHVPELQKLAGEDRAKAKDAYVERRKKLWPAPPPAAAPPPAVPPPAVPSAATHPEVDFPMDENGDRIVGGDDE